MIFIRKVDQTAKQLVDDSRLSSPHHLRPQSELHERDAILVILLSHTNFLKLVLLYLFRFLLPAAADWRCRCHSAAACLCSNVCVCVCEWKFYLLLFFCE